MSRLALKRKEFQTQIRRQQIAKRIHEIRKSVVEYDFISLQQLCSAFGFPHQQQRKYSVLDLLALKRHLLIKVPLGQMDQENNQRLPLDLHIRFWKYFSQQLYDQKVQYDSLIGEFLLQLIHKYTYAQVHYSTIYQLHILNMLELVAQNLTLKQRQQLIGWIIGAEGLRVIYACIEEGNFQFFHYRQNQNLYRVIQLGLKSELKSQSDQAAQILVKLLLAADWDDAYQLYCHAPGLTVNICKKIERYSKETVLKNYNNALYLLLNTYDEAVLDYARGHVAYATGLLICSPVQQNYSDGLEILHCMTQSGSHQIVKFLILYNETKKLGLWVRMCEQSFFAKHINPKVRQSYLSFFHNMLAVGQQQDLQVINGFFCGVYEDIFQMFASVLDNQNQTNENIVLVLKSLQSYLYYGKTENEPNILLPRFQSCGIYNNIGHRAQCNQSSSAQIVKQCVVILSTLHNTQCI